MKISAVLIFIIITFHVFLGKYANFLLENNSAFIRKSSLLYIENISSWEKQDTFDTNKIDWFLERFERFEESDPIKSEFFMALSCNYVKENNVDASYSFFNNVLISNEKDFNIQIMSFWMHRKIDLKKLKIINEYPDKFILDIDILFEHISKIRTLDSEPYSTITNYIRNGEIPNDLKDPCE